VRFISSLFPPDYKGRNEEMANAISMSTSSFNKIHFGLDFVIHSEAISSIVESLFGLIQ
jgi:hypothetical protein